MKWPNWLKIMLHWNLPTFGKKNPPKREKLNLDRVVDWESRKKHLDDFERRRNELNQKPRIDLEEPENNHNSK